MCMALSTTAVARLAEELVERNGLLRRAIAAAAVPPEDIRSVTTAEMELLRCVRRMPNICVNDAASALALAPNTVSTLVGTLREAGLLQSDTDGDDRRVKRLRLTPRAARQVQDWRDARMDAVQLALAELSPDDRTLLKSSLPVLERIAASLNAAAA